MLQKLGAKGNYIKILLRVMTFKKLLRPFVKTKRTFFLFYYREVINKEFVPVK